MHNGSDGKSLKSKLKVGFKTIIILITLSVQIKYSSGTAVDVEPETSSAPPMVNPLSARILHRSNRIKEFIEKSKIM